jgi:UDP-N-acetyl-2-amino-2-deoxyglucuronate dehydrogenase
MDGRQRLRVGVIGVGTAGQRHIAAYRKRPDVAVVAIVDPNLALGRDVAADLGARHFPEASEAFWDAIDVVSVCAPHHLLAAHAFQAIDHRKPVLLEKPMALTLADADAIVVGAREANVPVMVGFVHRFRAAAQAARRAIDEGAIGAPAFAVEHLISGGGPTPAWIWRRETAGGGVLLYNGVHGLDRLRWLLGRDVTEVYARAATASHAADVEDVMVATLVFEGGVAASLVQHIAPYPLPPGWRSEVYGAVGALLMTPDEALIRCEGERTIVLRAERDDRFLGEIAEFVEAVREERPPKVTAADGRAALAIALALYESAATGRPVAPA